MRFLSSNGDQAASSTTRTPVISAQKETGTGVTETVRDGLRKLASRRAQRELLELRGKVKFSMSWEELQQDRR